VLGGTKLLPSLLDEVSLFLILQSTSLSGIK